MLDPRAALAGKIVLVTGGAGFIGSHLVDHLIGYGARVICFDDLSTGSKTYVESMRGNNSFAFVKGDANNWYDLEPVFAKNKIDYVFHYAALVGVQRTVEEPLKVLADIDGIKHILELCRRYNVQKLVFASSSEVYGNQDQMPLHEEESYLDIRFPYAMVKSAGENFLRSYWEISGLPITILRFFNAYGPRQISSGYGFVVGVFITSVLQHKPPSIFHDGTQTRDFMYIDDNVEAAIQALINPKANGETFNLGTGIEMSILDLAKKIIALNGTPNLMPTMFNKRKIAEIKRRVADTTKMQTLLGFTPRYGLEEGLRLTYEWYKNNPQLISKKGSSYEEYRQKVWVPQEFRKEAQQQE